MNDSNSELLFERENEFSTDKVVRIGDHYFYVVANGGARGGWQDRGDTVTTIDLAEARRLGLEFGEDIETVAARTGANNGGDVQQ